MLVLYLIDKRRHIKKTDDMPTGDFTKQLLGISMPIALSAYLRSGLVTVEHVLIPRGLRLYGNRTQGGVHVFLLRHRADA